MEKTRETVATRSSNQSCTHCKFSGSLVAADNTIRMVCRRNAPPAFAQAFPTQQNQILWATNTAWPAITDADWCGEFEPQPPLLSS